MYPYEDNCVFATWSLCTAGLLLTVSSTYRAGYFDVRSADVMGTGMPMDKDYGLVFFDTKWEVSKENEKL